MRVYRWVWWSGCGVLAVLGVLVSVGISATTTRDVAATAAVAGGLGALAVWRVADHRPGATCVAFVVRGAVLTASAVTAALGLAVALGANFFAASLAVLLSSPGAVGGYYRWVIGLPRITAADINAAMVATAWASPGFVPVVPVSPQPRPPQAQPRPRRFTDEELCARWRASTAAVSAGSLAAVEERRVLLAELERRNPSGFPAWLVEGAPPEALLARPDQPAHLRPAQADGRGMPRWRSR